MSPVHQRIAIAEECEWIPAKQESLMGFWFNPDGSDRMATVDGLPDYLNDLNVIFGVWVKHIFGNEKLEDKYSLNLGLVCGCEDPDDGGRPSFSDADWAKLSNATAAQRAEAFLKTTNKWEP